MTVEQDRPSSRVHSAPRSDQGPRLRDLTVNKAKLDHRQSEIFLWAIGIGIPFGTIVAALKALHIL